MGVGISTAQFTGYIASLAVIFIVGLVLFTVFKAPLKFIALLIFNSLLGGVILFVLNFVLALFGIEIGVNLFTAVVTGLLGVPGLVLLLILTILL